MKTAELRRASAEMAEAMAEMRLWLEREAPARCKFEVGFLPGREVRFRLQFYEAADARAFVRAFGGTISEPMAA